MSTSEKDAGEMPRDTERYGECFGCKGPQNGGMKAGVSRD